MPSEMLGTASEALHRGKSSPQIANHFSGLSGVSRAQYQYATVNPDMPYMTKPTTKAASQPQPWKFGSTLRSKKDIRGIFGLHKGRPGPINVYLNHRSAALSSATILHDSACRVDGASCSLFVISYLLRHFFIFVMTQKKIKTKNEIKDCPVGYRAPLMRATWRLRSGGAVQFVVQLSVDCINIRARRRTPPTRVV